MKGIPKSSVNKYIEYLEREDRIDISAKNLRFLLQKHADNNNKSITYAYLSCIPGKKITQV